MGRKAQWPPKLSHHKPSGRARVRWKRRDYPMGAWDLVNDQPSEEARSNYRQFLARIEAGEPAQPEPKAQTMSVRDVVAEWAAKEAPKYSERGRQRQAYRWALRPLLELYGGHPADDFAIRQLEQLRLAMGAGSWMTPEQRKRLEERGQSPRWSAGVCNARIGRIRTVWRWAEQHGYVPEGRWAHLCSLPPILGNDARFRHTEDTRACTYEELEAVALLAVPPVAAMIRLQYWTGMRPGEVRRMRAEEIDTTSEEWIYRPSEHKTEHHGHTRAIALGPNARDVLRPWLMMAQGSEAYLFPPTRRAKHPYYTDVAYDRAVKRAAVAAGLEEFHPYQARHAAKARVLAEGGTLDDARAMLGQKSVIVTNEYSAGVDLDTARKAARKVG